MPAETPQFEPCRLCGRETKPVRDEPFRVSYHRCPFCEFLSIEEKGLPSPEEERQEYLLHDNRMENAGYVRHLEAFIRQGVQPFLGSARTVLEFGCGPGPVLAELLKRRGLFVDIYDPFFFPEKVQEGKGYDLITATEVLEHIRDPLESFLHLGEHLNDNGILAVMTQFHPRDDTAFRNWWYRKELSHISFFTPVTLSFLAGRAGMRFLWTDHEKIFVVKKTSPRGDVPL